MDTILTLGEPLGFKESGVVKLSFLCIYMSLKAYYGYLRLVILLILRQQAVLKKAI